MKIPLQSEIYLINERIKEIRDHLKELLNDLNEKIVDCYNEFRLRQDDCSARIINLEKKTKNLSQSNEKDTEPCITSPKWKKWQRQQINGLPEDDKTYLVSWKDAEQNYVGPYNAYYLEEENKFFLCECLCPVPVHVDIFIEIPLFPGKDE
jgi:hypothetical protein